MSPETGRTRDAGWEIGVSRTVPYPPQQVWDLLVSQDGLALWLGPGAVVHPTRGAPYETTDGTVGETRSYHPGERLRITCRPSGWEHDTTVQVVVVPASGDRTSLRFHQERLVDADEREQQRAHWRGVLDALEDALRRAP